MMTEHTKTRDLPTEEHKKLLQRASAGDKSVLPEVKDLVEAMPEFAAEVGNLSTQVEQALVDQIARNDLVAKEVLSLPMFPEMTEDQMDRIVEAVRSYF